MNTHTVFWLCLAVVLGLIEALTPTLVTIWPAISALVTAVFAALGVNNVWLAMIFIIISAILLICTRPLAKKFTNTKNIATNADRIIGSDGIVVKRIDPIDNSGQVKIMGQIWSAKSADNTIIEESTNITVTALEGVKAVVIEKNAQD